MKIRLLCAITLLHWTNVHTFRWLKIDSCVRIRNILHIILERMQLINQLTKLNEQILMNKQNLMSLMNKISKFK